MTFATLPMPRPRPDLEYDVRFFVKLARLDLAPLDAEIRAWAVIWCGRAMPNREAVRRVIIEPIEHELDEISRAHPGARVVISLSGGDRRPTVSLAPDAAP